MFINDRHLSQYGGNVTKRNILPSTHIRNIEWLSKSFEPLYLDDRYEYKQLEIGIELQAKDAETLEENKSALINDINKTTIAFDDLPYIFEGHLDKVSSNFVTTTWSDLDITFLCICRKPETVYLLDKKVNQEIVVEGNIKTPCIYEIKALTSIIDFEINGIKVHNVPLGSTLVIDGKKCLITLDGTNKFGDSTLIEFPFLVPGKNTIKVNNVNCEIKVKYEPRYI